MKPEEYDLTKEIVSRAVHSIRRVRSLFMALLLATGLGFAGFWNSLDIGWLDARIEKYEKARLLAPAICALDSANDRHAQVKLQTLLDSLDLNNYQFLNLKGEFKKYWLCTKSKDSTYLYYDLQEKLKLQWASRVQNVWLIKIPWLGIYFDINDLSLLGGIGFVILMGCLRYTMHLRYENIKMAFEVLKGEDSHGLKRNLFNLMSMSLVLTRAHKNHQEKPPSWLGITPFRAIPFFLMLMPLIVHLGIIVNDLGTAFKGLGSDWMWIAFGLSWSSWFLLLTLISGCWRIETATTKYWNDNCGSYVEDTMKEQINDDEEG